MVTEYQRMMDGTHDLTGIVKCQILCFKYISPKDFFLSVEIIFMSVMRVS